jgi:type II secretory pathway component PulF
MPQFAYQARKGPREIVNGTIEADSLEQAVEKLGDEGLLPVRLDEVKGASPAPDASAGPREPERPRGAPAPHAAAPAAGAAPAAPARRGGRIRSAEITLFGRQLSSLIKSGVPILRALMIISDQTVNARFREFLSSAEEDIKNGKPLSGVLAAYPRLFPPLYVAMVRAGEDSGQLHETLLRISDYRRRQEEVVSKVRSAMAYPALMGLTGVGTVAFMLTFVIPRLTGLFEGMGGELPAPTRILMAVSAGLRTPVFWAAAGGLFAAGVLAARFQGPRLGGLWSRASLAIPFVRDFVLKSELGRFTRTLELLIKCGIPILRGLEIAAPVVANDVLRGAIERARGELSGGGSLGKSLRQSGRFPVFMTNLVSVGEESGNLDGALGEIASYYEQEVEEAIKTLTSLIEPLMILSMGLVVGFIVIAMLLPMFELNMMVK